MKIHLCSELTCISKYERDTEQRHASPEVYIYIFFPPGGGNVVIVFRTENLILKSSDYFKYYFFFKTS